MTEEIEEKELEKILKALERFKAATALKNEWRDLMHVGAMIGIKAVGSNTTARDIMDEIESEIDKRWSQ